MSVRYIFGALWVYTFELDIAVNDVLRMQILYGGNQFRKDAADQARR